MNPTRPRNLLDESRERAAAARAAFEAARTAATDAAREVGQRRGGAALMRREHEGRAGESAEEALARGADADRLEREAVALEPRAHALQEGADKARREADRARADLEARCRRAAVVAADALPESERLLGEARHALAVAQAQHDLAVQKRNALAGELDSLGEPTLEELRVALDDLNTALRAEGALRWHRKAREAAA